MCETRCCVVAVGAERSRAAMLPTPRKRSVALRVRRAPPPRPRRRASARSAVVQRVDARSAAGRSALPPERADGALRGRAARLRAVPEAVDDEHDASAAPATDRPGVAALVLAAASARRQRHQSSRRARSSARCTRMPAAITVPGRLTCRCRSVAETRWIAPRPVPGVPAVEKPSRRLASTFGDAAARDRARSAARPMPPRRPRPRAAISPPPRVLHEVGRHLGDHERHAPGVDLVEARAARERVGRSPPRLGRRWLDVRTGDERCRAAHFHRVIVTRVPSPGRDDDLELVREPPRAAEAEAQPAAGRVAVLSAPARCRRCPAPGPRTSAAARCGRSLSTFRSRSVPPPPWTSVLRASSLAAVTILVWSTRLKPELRRPQSRTAWRTRTTSSSARDAAASHARSDRPSPSADRRRRAAAAPCPARR